MAQSFNEADREMLARYGKMPTHKNLLSQKLKVRLVSQGIVGRNQRGERADRGRERAGAQVL